MNKEIITDMCDSTPQTKKNTKRLFIWSVVWVLATAGVAFGPKNLWNFNTLPTILGVLIHIGIGSGPLATKPVHPSMIGCLFGLRFLAYLVGSGCLDLRTISCVRKHSRVDKHFLGRFVHNLRDDGISMLVLY